MSIDRAKALKAAQKYLAKGQIDRAIVEYEKVVATDPNDPRSLLKLGDLYTRTGDNKGAITSYRKVAHQYGQQGFFLKAVAVYKQILKLDPNDLATTESLAEMYEALSLTSDALATYEQVADAYLAAGKSDKAVKALGKVAELDPQNVAAWVRSAEALSKANFVDDAAAAFARAADLLKAQNRVDDYIKVAERLLFHSHEDLDRARELASLYIERGQAKAALAHLQTCFKSNPTDPATLVLLARAFQGLGQTPKAVAVYRELARVRADAGQEAEELEAWRALLEIDPGNQDAQHRVDALSGVPQAAGDDVEEVTDDEIDEVVIVDEEPTGGIEPIQAPFAEPERNAQIARLMAECEVFTRYGLRDKVIAQLNRVLDLDPNHIEAREKLKEAHLKRGDVGSAVIQLLLLSESAAAEDPERASRYLEEAANLNPENEAVQERLRELRASRAPAAPSEVEEDDESVFFVDEDEDAAAAGASEPPGPSPFTPPRLGPREISLATQLEGGDDAEPELLLEDSSDNEPELSFEPGAEDDEGPSYEFEAEADEDAGHEPSQVPAPARADEDIEIPPELVEVIEEADFYLAQELVDEARDVLTEALEEHPDHPALLAKLASLDGGAGAAGAGEPVEDHSFELAEKLAAEPSGGTQSPQDVEQVLQQFRAGVARQVAKGDTATHYDLGIAYMEMGLHAEAIAEFKLCLEEGQRQCVAHTMLGLSYVAKGEMAMSVDHFKRALASPDCTPDEQIGLWFELGNASELLGKASEALVWYEKAEERNPEFRDVAARIERLGVTRSEAQEGDEFDAMFDNMIVKD